MKLLQINTVINWGSTGHIAEEIGQVAITNGWDNYIAFGRWERESSSIKIKIGNRWDFYWHVLLTRLFDLHGLGSKRATKKLITQIEEIKPDIIHLHNIHGYYLNYKILYEYFKTTNIPVVWTLHDCWAFTGHCAHFSFVNCKKWQTECNHCPQKHTYPQSVWKDRSRLNFLDKKESFSSCKDLIKLIPVSNWLSDLIQKSFLNGMQTQRIYNGIDVNIFKPLEGNNKNDILLKYGIKEKFLILGVAAQWTIRKGLDDFIKLSTSLSDDSIILLVGLTKNQINTLPNNIIGIEKTENINELTDLYSIADIFVNLSYEETFGLTTVEAMSCGTPSIVYNTTACPEIVTQKTGIVVDPGDIEGILNAIDIIKTNGKEKYSAHCRKRAIDNFNKEDKYKEYIDLYKELLKK